MRGIVVSQGWLIKMIEDSPFLDKLELVRDMVQAAVGVCYYSPLVENVIEGIYGLRFFFDHGKSMVIECLGTVDDIIGIEFFEGLKTYADSPGEILVTFSESRPLSQILPFVKDFLEGKITEPGGIYLSNP